MRLSGVVESARDLVPNGHLCWGYRSRSEFRARVLEFLSDGVAQGQWVELVGSGPIEELREEMSSLDGVGDLIAAGRVGVSRVRDFYRFYPDSDVVDPVASVSARVSAGIRARAAGYTSFRAAVDATEVVRRRAQREGFARFEHLLDQKMSAQPGSALCAYDLEQLGGETVAEMACLHPLLNEGTSAFRMHAERGVDLVLGGEIDLASSDLFQRTLARILSLSSGPELVIDSRGLAFIDHAGLLALEAQARERNRSVVMRDAAPGVARLGELLSPTHLRVEVAGAFSPP